MDLHGQIMNLPQTPSGDFEKHAANPAWRGYQIGHRDARHAAAELVLKADAEIKRLCAALYEIAHADMTTKGFQMMAAEAMDPANSVLVSG